MKLLERLNYIEIQLKKARVSLMSAKKHNRVKGRVETLESYVRQLQDEKTYLYGRMMRERVY